jgi:hypothetical protein
MGASVDYGTQRRRSAGQEREGWVVHGRFDLDHLRRHDAVDDKGILGHTGGQLDGRQAGGEDRAASALRNASD